MRVRFTPSARLQFLETLTYIRRDKSSAALKFRDKAEKLLRRLEKFPESGFVEELADRVITAVRHLTNVTSLTREGLEAYQRDRSHALAEVLESTSLTSSVRVQGVLQAVEAFLHFEVESRETPIPSAP